MSQPALPGLLLGAEPGRWLPVAAADAAHEAVMNKGLPVVCLYGPAGVGKSHLLARAAQGGVQLWDDLQTALPEAQHSLFHALQAALTGGARVAVASALPVAQLQNLLPDVKSRLLLAPQIEVGLPTEAELRALLAHWAIGRQLRLPGAVADYILARAARNPAVLHGLLLRLDGLSLQEKRGITVPLAKRVLEA